MRIDNHLRPTYQLLLLCLLLDGLLVQVEGMGISIGKEGDDDNNDVCRETILEGLEEFSLPINSKMSLKLLQAPSSHREVTTDETGRVVWGASVCLGRFLSSSTTLIHDKVVLELGCGLGVPSLVAAKLGARRVIATDMTDATLQQLDQVVQRNQCQGNFEVYKLEWGDQNDDNNYLIGLQAGVVLASDVIYHEDMVYPLVKTIRAYLSTEGGKAYIALRNSRQGVSTFWQKAMPEAGMSLIEAISCASFLNADTDDELPPGFQQENQRHRFRGDHTIYVFERNGK